VARLERLKAQVAHGGASSQAAEYILGALADRPVPVIRPHFVPAGRSWGRNLLIPKD
jgi:hypothetical protein